jgi:hypothetical protein
LDALLPTQLSLHHQMPSSMPAESFEILDANGSQTFQVALLLRPA